MPYISKAIHQGKLHEFNSLHDASVEIPPLRMLPYCIHLGWKPTICLPANASAERKKYFEIPWCRTHTLLLPLEGTDGCSASGRELKEADPNLYFYADQYSNPANWQAH
jgi:cysteine synthase B